MGVGAIFFGGGAEFFQGDKILFSKNGKGQFCRHTIIYERKVFPLGGGKFFSQDPKGGGIFCMSHQECGSPPGGKDG